MNPNLELTLDVTLPVTRQAIWAAWTRPELLSQWFLPAPMRCRVRRLEPTPLGALVSEMSDDGQTFVPHLDAVFLDVKPAELIVFTNALTSELCPAVPTPVAITAHINLSDVTGGTRYQVVVTHADVASRDTHRGLGFSEGWTTVTKQLVDVVEQLEAK